jgi:hypothetical protein
MKKAAGWMAAAIGVAVYLREALPYLGSTQFDDAYMFVRYAKHFLAGSGFAWNIGAGPAFGATSTLHLLVVTGLRAVTAWSDAMVLTAVSLSAGLVSVALLTAAGFLVLDIRDECRQWLPWLVPPLIVFSAAFRAHSLSGMDTTLSMMCNAGLVVAIAACVRRPTAARLAASIAAGYLCVLARPDSGVYALLAAPLCLIASDRTPRKYAAIYVGILAGVLAGDLVLKRQLFGTALPLPFYAKQGGVYLGYLGADHWNPVASTLDFVAGSFPFIVVMVLLARQRALPTLAAILVPVTITLSYFFSVLQIMGQDARYQYPSLPFVVFAAFVAVRDRSRALALSPSLAVRAAAIAVISVFVVRSPVSRFSIRAWQDLVVGRPTVFEPHTRYVVRSRSHLPQLEWWESIVEMTAFAGALPPDTTLAASEYGYLGAEHPALRIVDLVGLHDPRFADHGFSADRVFANEPDVLWLPHQDYSYAIQQLVDASVFAREYEYYPDAYRYGVALRTTSPRYAAVKAAFEKDFSRVYGRRPDDYVASPLLRGTHEVP